jgi:hypothetical protein
VPSTEYGRFQINNLSRQHPRLWARLYAFSVSENLDGSDLIAGFQTLESFEGVDRVVIAKMMFTFLFE